jgi:hypothetical protein
MGENLGEKPFANLGENLGEKPFAPTGFVAFAPRGWVEFNLSLLGSALCVKP